MTVDMHTGEIVPHMSAASARSLTDEIRASLVSAHDKLMEAWRGRADLALGYESWDSYCAGEFTEQRMIRLDRDQRREIVAEMRGEGMSTRAIGSALGASEGTVRNDLRDTAGAQDYAPDPTPTTGIDGKTYPPRRAEPDVVDAEIVEGEQGTPSPTTPRAAPRRALTDQFFDAAYDLSRAVERVQRITQDDRWPTNKAQISSKHEAGLRHSADLLAEVLRSIDSNNR